MKTVEILIVIVLTTIFLVTIFERQPSNTIIRKSSYLIHLEKDVEFRDFIINNDGCFGSSELSIDSLIKNYLAKEYDYMLCSDEKANELPVKKINVDTLFFSGNLTSTKIKTIRLYYWTKD